MPSRERRAFLRPAEVPGLIGGALRGEPRALRRILGARHGGRWGLALAAVALLLAAPGPGAALASVGLHGLLGLSLSRAHPGPHRLDALRWMRVAHWSAAPLLLVAALLRALVPESPVPGLAAVAAAHLLLWRGLRGGLGEGAAG